MGITRSIKDLIGIKRWRKGNLAIFLLEPGYLTSPALGHQHPGSWGFRFRLGVKPLHRPLRFSSIWTQTESCHQLSWFSGSQTADCRAFQPPQPCEANPTINLLIYTYLFRWFCFSGGPLIRECFGTLLKLVSKVTVSLVPPYARPCLWDAQSCQIVPEIHSLLCQGVRLMTVACLSCVPQPYIGGVTATFPLPNQNPQSGFCFSDGTLIYTVYH